MKLFWNPWVLLAMLAGPVLLAWRFAGRLRSGVPWAVRMRRLVLARWLGCETREDVSDAGTRGHRDMPTRAAMITGAR